MNDRENAAFVWLIRTINKLNVGNYALKKEIEELQRQIDGLSKTADGWCSEVEYMKKLDRNI